MYAGLSAIDWPCDVVLIHDGARPLTKEEDIETVYRTVLTDEAAVAAHPSKDTIKIVDDRQIVTDTLERSHLWNVQTPQGFSRTLIEKAYAELMADRKNNAPIFVTDDASAVELYTEKKVKLVETSSWNLKVTTPEDLEQIGILLEYRKKTTEENT